jgi:RNA polymerase sigma factor (sigma-70 family)
MSSDDVDLVLAARSGDRTAWAGIYDRYADRLHDFCWSVLRDRDEAGDAMHDTFITAYKKLDQLRDPTRLRSWLFAIARNEALAHARKRGRATPTDELEVTATTGGPHEAAETAELRDLVWAAAAGLADRDRAALDLHLRQGLEGAALGEALGTSADNANVLMSRLRDQVERSLGALLVATKGRRDCAGLDALLASWDGAFSPLWRKRIARHVDDCPTCDDSRRRMVSPLALLAGVAVLPAPTHLRDRVLHDIDLISHTRPVEDARRRRLATIAVAAALLLLVAALVFRQTGSSESKPTQLATARTLADDAFLPAAGDPATASTLATGSDTTGAQTTRTSTRGTATTSRATSLPTTTSTVPPRLQVTIVRAPSSTTTCPTAPLTVYAHITGATPPMRSVQLRWSGPTASDRGGVGMQGGPTDWNGNLGPFDTVGTVTYYVIAFDADGKTGQSATRQLRVDPCPQ